LVAGPRLLPDRSSLLANRGGWLAASWLAARPCLLANRSCLVADRPHLLSNRPCLVAYRSHDRPHLLDRPCLVADNSSLLSNRLCLVADSSSLVADRPHIANWVRRLIWIVLGRVVQT